MSVHEVLISDLDAIVIAEDDVVITGFPFNEFRYGYIVPASTAQKVIGDVFDSWYAVHKSFGGGKKIFEIPGIASRFPVETYFPSYRDSEFFAKYPELEDVKSCRERLQLNDNEMEKIIENKRKFDEKIVREFVVYIQCKAEKVDITSLWADEDITEEFLLCMLHVQKMLDIK